MPIKVRITTKNPIQHTSREASGPLDLQPNCLSPSNSQQNEDMIDQLMHPAVFLAALGSGLIAGVFFGFSTFIMKALSRLPAYQGIAAMQSINIVVLNPLFLGIFVGTALLSLFLVGAAFWTWQNASPWLVAGGVLYGIGCFMVTAAGNVPLNNALAPQNPTSPEAAAFWQQYLRRWTIWNHVRTLASLAAMGAFIGAMLAR
ncbi:DUF1772 domain-containing protein [Lacibacterium aquatile]|uniref:DUF1772 domain-containing protein n=1 Tax=Lacibacterium aquatile TaxID=1168082 RepID=A0ABW5DMN0_9PROT